MTPIPNIVLRELADSGRVWYCIDMDGKSESKPYYSSVWAASLAKEMLHLRSLVLKIASSNEMPDMVDAMLEARRMIPTL